MLEHCPFGVLFATGGVQWERGDANLKSGCWVVTSCKVIHGHSCTDPDVPIRTSKSKDTLDRCKDVGYCAVATADFRSDTTQPILVVRTVSSIPKSIVKKTIASATLTKGNLKRQERKKHKGNV